MISRLFWRKKVLAIPEDGLIRFRINRVEYSFQIYDPEAFFSVQRGLAKIYYDELDLSQVHLFTIQNRFLGSVEPRLQFDANDLGVLAKHRKQKKEIDGYARSQKKSWEDGIKDTFSKKVFKPQFHDHLIDEDISNDQMTDMFVKLNGIKPPKSQVLL